MFSLMKILVTGSTAYDFLLHSDGSFAEGIEGQDMESLSVGFLAHRLARHHGGTAANIAWGVSLLGGDSLTVSSVGKDGGEYKALLSERGIDVTHIEQLDDYVTATAILATDSHERQIIFFHPGADQHGSWPDLADDREDFSHAIISPRDRSLMLKAAAWCKEFGVPYFFDPGQQILGFSEDELRQGVEGSAGVIVNEYEWGLVQQKLNCTEENIQTITPTLIVTRGEHGVTVFTESGAETIAACKADQIVNPTGAGDALRAGLLVGLNAGWSLRDSVRLGASMGSFAVEIEGTLLDSIDREEVFLRAQSTYTDPLPEL